MLLERCCCAPARRPVSTVDLRRRVRSRDRARAAGMLNERGRRRPRSKLNQRSLFRAPGWPLASVVYPTTEDPPEHARTAPLRKGVAPGEAAFEGGGELTGDGELERFARLCLLNAQHALVEIDLISTQAEHLGAPHAGVEPEAEGDGIAHRGLEAPVPPGEHHGGAGRCYAAARGSAARPGSAPLRPARSPRAAFGRWGLGGGLARSAPVTARQALRGRIGANRVVTGAKIGLRASRGKDRANRKSREALVTGWYGAATTELPPAAWSAEADVGAERRNQVPLSRSIAMSCGQTPRPRHDGPLLTGGGLAQPKRRGGCRVDSCGHAATGEPPGIDEASEPWRVALQAGPGALTPWPCGRTATLASAARRNRARGHCRTPTRRSRRLGRQRKAS